jgi:phage gp46-like protein
MLQMIWDNYGQTVDLQRDGNFVSNELLYTAVMISLFSRRRANDDDVLPTQSPNRGGWWADAYAEVDGDKIGSRLWLLNRSTLNQSTLNLAREYALEALQWMVDDGIASSVDVSASMLGQEILVLTVNITRPTKPATKWSGIWEAHMEQL